jgi:hypothetical protein
MKYLLCYFLSLSFFGCHTNKHQMTIQIDQRKVMPCYDDSIAIEGCIGSLEINLAYLNMNCFTGLTKRFERVGSKYRLTHTDLFKLKNRICIDSSYNTLSLDLVKWKFYEAVGSESAPITRIRYDSDEFIISENYELTDTTICITYYPNLKQVFRKYYEFSKDSIVEFRKNGRIKKVIVRDSD